MLLAPLPRRTAVRRLPGIALDLLKGLHPRAGASTGLTVQGWSCNLWLVNASGEMILSKLRRKKPELISRYPIQHMALFGSRVRGDFTNESDVDILVDVDPKIGLRFVELADEIEQLLGMKVDLVSHRSIRADHMEAIKADLVDV